MRTDEEILERIEQIKGNDFLGTETFELICRLPFEKAKPYLREDATQSDWTQMSRDRETILKEMLEYMSFAWDKACNKRGISASRSMSHYAGWTWLIGDDFGDLQDYQFYGKDNLVRICEKYGWDHKQWDDGVRENE